MPLIKSAYVSCQISCHVNADNNWLETEVTTGGLA